MWQFLWEVKLFLKLRMMRQSRSCAVLFPSILFSEVVFFIFCLLTLCNKQIPRKFAWNLIDTYLYCRIPLGPHHSGLDSQTLHHMRSWCEYILLYCIGTDEGSILVGALEQMKTQNSINLNISFKKLSKKSTRNRNEDIGNKSS